MTEEIEKKPIEQVLGTILQMQQYYQQIVNMETAKILHDNGWCKEYIDKCPICEQEKEQKKKEKGDEEE